MRGPRRSPDRPDRSPGGWDVGEPDWSFDAWEVREPDWSPDGRDFGEPVRSSDDPGSAARVRPVRAGRPARRPVRLTRRGRIVVGAFLLAAVLGLLALLAPPTQAAPPTGPPRTVTVHTGDTLYSIATRADPARPPYAVMAEIRRLNHMTGTTVYAGQQLVLPPS